jgi:hypothetical protein
MTIGKAPAPAVGLISESHRPFAEARFWVTRGAFIQACVTAQRPRTSGPVVRFALLRQQVACQGPAWGFLRACASSPALRTHHTLVVRACKSPCRGSERSATRGVADGAPEMTRALRLPVFSPERRCRQPSVTGTYTFAPCQPRLCASPHEVGSTRGLWSSARYFAAWHGSPERRRPSLLTARARRIHPCHALACVFGRVRLLTAGQRESASSLRRTHIWHQQLVSRSAPRPCAHLHPRVDSCCLTTQERR